LYDKDGKRRYCTYPFRLLAVASDLLKPCTWLRQINYASVLPIGAGSRPNLDEVWHSETFNTVRRTVANGGHIYCDLGNCPEYLGEQKYFLTLEEIEKQFPAIARFVSSDATDYEEGPRLFNISYNTECNLSCPFCNRDQLRKLDRDTADALGASLSSLGAEVRSIYLAGMGDPFGTPHYLRWLRALDVAQFGKLELIILNTNAIAWTEEAWNSIPEKTRAFIKTAAISIDGARRESYETNRYPAKFDQLLARLELISSLRRSGPLDCLRAYFVYQANNFRELPEMVALCRKFAFDEVFFARIRNWRNWRNEYLASLDVNNPSHPNYAEFCAIAERTKAMGDRSLTVTVMR